MAGSASATIGADEHPASSKALRSAAAGGRMAGDPKNGVRKPGRGDGIENLRHDD